MRPASNAYRRARREPRASGRNRVLARTDNVMRTASGWALGSRNGIAARPNAGPPAAHKDPLCLLRSWPLALRARTGAGLPAKSNQTNNPAKRTGRTLFFVLGLVRFWAEILQKCFT